MWEEKVRRQIGPTRKIKDLDELTRGDIILIDVWIGIFEWVEGWNIWGSYSALDLNYVSPYREREYIDDDRIDLKLRWAKYKHHRIASRRITSLDRSWGATYLNAGKAFKRRSVYKVFIFDWSDIWLEGLELPQLPSPYEEL